MLRFFCLVLLFYVNFSSAGFMDYVNWCISGSGASEVVDPVAPMGVGSPSSSPRGGDEGTPLPSRPPSTPVVEVPLGMGGDFGRGAVRDAAPVVREVVEGVEAAAAAAAAVAGSVEQAGGVVKDFGPVLDKLVNTADKTGERIQIGLYIVAGAVVVGGALWFIGTRIWPSAEAKAALIQAEANAQQAKTDAKRLEDEKEARRLEALARVVAAQAQKTGQ